jgi:hypothetical protein
MNKLYSHHNGAWKYTIGIMISIHVGSIDEIDIGMNHFAEHMLFSGFEHISLEEMSQRYGLIFNHLEATTSRDCVKIFCYFDKKYFNIAIETIKEMLWHWKPNKDNWNAEKENLVQEYQNYFSSTLCSLHMQNMSLMNLSNTSVLGSKDFAKNLTFKDVKKAKIYWENILQNHSISAVSIGKLNLDQQESLQNAFTKEGIDNSIISITPSTYIQNSSSAAGLILKHKHKHINHFILERIIHWRSTQFGIQRDVFYTNILSTAGYIVHSKDEYIRNKILDKNIGYKEFYKGKMLAIESFRRDIDLSNPIETMHWLAELQHYTYEPKFCYTLMDYYKYIKQLKYNDFMQWFSEYL